MVPPPCQGRSVAFVLIDLGEREKERVDSSMDMSAPVGCGGGRGECCCRDSGDDAEGKEKSAKMAQVVPVDDVVAAAAVAEAELVVPYVMAVDDSSVDRAVITALLRRSKYKVTAVDSGKRALEILDLEPNVSMIITDYWMTEMTGYDLLKKVKESSELKQIPVVIMSSENVPTRITRCLEEGAEEFLLKPVRPSDISRISTRMLQ